MLSSTLLYPAGFGERDTLRFSGSHRLKKLVVVYESALYSICCAIQEPFVVLFTNFLAVWHPKCESPHGYLPYPSCDYCQPSRPGLPFVIMGIAFAFCRRKPCPKALPPPAKLLRSTRLNPLLKPLLQPAI